MFFWGKHPIRDVDLSAYVDGQLEPSARDRLEAHIETCTPCRDELAELRMLRSALRELPPATAPRSFALREADVRAEAKPSLTPARPPALLGGLASVALIAFVALVGLDVFSQPSTGGDADATGAISLPLSAEGGTGDEAAENGGFQSNEMDGGSLAGLETVEPNETEGFSFFPADDASGPETNNRGEIGSPDEETTDNSFATPDCPPGRECKRLSSGAAEPGPEAAPDLAAESEDDSRLPLRAGEAAAAAVALVAGGSFALIWRRRRI